jgi:hypothetical protein
VGPVTCWSMVRASCWILLWRLLRVGDRHARSEQTSQVKVLNVNWTAGADAEDGRFEVMIVTADGENTFSRPAQPR